MNDCSPRPFSVEEIVHPSIDIGQKDPTNKHITICMFPLSSEQSIFFANHKHISRIKYKKHLLRTRKTNSKHEIRHSKRIIKHKFSKKYRNIVRLTIIIDEFFVAIVSIEA